MATTVLMTGATGYIANQLLPTFAETYRMVLVDVNEENREGERVEGVVLADLIDTDRSKYAHLFEGVDAVVHLGYTRRTGNPLDHFHDENRNVVMAYNVLRCAYESRHLAGRHRRVPTTPLTGTSTTLIHDGKMTCSPLPVATVGQLLRLGQGDIRTHGFLFACGFGDFVDDSGRQEHTRPITAQRKMGVVMVRIGAPRDLDPSLYQGNPANYKRDLGAYLSPRDLTQLISKAVETPNIDNEHGIPWQVVYGISNNTRAFWSLANAQRAGYQPQERSELELYANDIQQILAIQAPGGKVGPPA